MKIKKLPPLIWIAFALLVLLAISIIVSVSQVVQLKNDIAKANSQNEQLRLDNEQLQLDNEYQAINAEFRQYEDQAVKLQNDSIMAKYTAAKNKVEQLMKELKNEKGRSQQRQARIKELEGQIETLRGLLRHYVSQIDSLNKENAGLKAENAEIKNRNEALSSQVQEVSQQNQNLNERMTLAEKLNVTGVTLKALKKNGKEEKNITKARQLMVTFTIPQNNSTPVGAKSIYLRILNPEGSLLGVGPTFKFEGRQLPSTAHKTIEYAGEEITGIKMYFDVNTTLNPGDYTVELFADNYRLASRHFTLTK